VFDYNEAFSRNLGLVTEDEQLILKSKKIAIAGLGGVGGFHLQALSRLGIENFHIADMDTFELANFNRQSGALMNSLDKPKVDVLLESALDINPNAKIKTFPQGVTEDNLDEFLDGVDLYVDGLDFFVLDMRARVFERCREKNITAITAGPIGMTTAYLVFDPNGMSFEDYFQFKDLDSTQKSVRFLAGLTPGLLQMGQFIDERYINFSQKKGPSLAVACYACAAVMGTEVLKLLLGRGETRYAPWAAQFDMYRNRHRKVYNFMGNRNPLNKLKIKIFSDRLCRMAENNSYEEHTYKRDIEQVLDVAKWAPSGDNSQPWAVSLLSEHEFSLDLKKAPKDVYSLFPMPHLISSGMFLENATMAARQKGLGLKWTLKGQKLSAHLEKTKKKQEENALYPYIKMRSVNRYPYKLKPMPPAVKQAATQELDDDIQVYWLESFADKLNITKIMMQTTDIRLRLPETYEIHRDMVDWSGNDSPDKMPYSSLGMNKLSTSSMRWSLAKRSRSEFLFKMPGSTFPIQMEVDFIPGLMCSGHFVMCFDREKTPKPTAQDYIRAGASMQRFWLALSSHHMSLQPWYIPVMFSRYIQDGIDFTTEQSLLPKTQKLHDQLTDKILEPLGIELDHVFFTGRVGYPTKTNIKRSVRKNLKDLIVSDYLSE